MSLACLRSESAKEGVLGLPMAQTESGACDEEGSICK